ncbi:PAN domain protein [Trichinella nativa]|uniref:PAN domain protein n=1 Tax=Trichinella nativa TaxID=6335 RepID=A0A1Y3EMQ6_9BILA|nr:PAN domain protein [Trichinella nativa]
MRADTAIANGAPFERRSEIGCEECLKFCLDKRPGTGSYQCLSVVYDYMRSVCDLYAVHGNSFPQPSESCVLTTEVSTFECEGSTLPKLILLQNFVSTTIPFYDLSGHSEAECLTACKENRDKYGSPLKLGDLKCQTAQFSSRRMCQLSSQPIDLYNLEENSGSKLYSIRCYAKNGASFKQRATWNGYQSFVKALKDYPELSGWTEWSPCCSATNLQYRYERCSEKDVRHCNKQTRKCKIAT